MSKRSGVSLEQLWQAEDRFSALAGSAIGALRIPSRNTPDAKVQDDKSAKFVKKLPHRFVQSTAESATKWPRQGNQLGVKRSSRTPDLPHSVEAERGLLGSILIS